MGYVRLGRLYVAAVIALAFGATTFLALSVPFVRPGSDWVAILLFAPFVIAGEQRPIAMPRREGGEINISTMFAYAILICAGTLPAIVVLGAASLAADVVRRKPWWKGMFNIAQYAVSLLAAREVVGLLTTHSVANTLSVGGWRDLLGILIGSLAFTMTNLMVTKAAIALFTGRHLLRYLFEDLGFQLVVTEITLLMSPILVAAEQRSPGLVPFLILPMLSLERSAAVSVDRDHQALHDSLTDLPNRVLFRDRAWHAIRSAKRQDGIAAVMIIDLDRFKEVNDTLGHHTGDLLLKEVGARLVGCLPESATVARLGGDEFGVVLPDVESAEAAEAFASQLLDTLAEPFLVNGLRLDVPGSIGIAVAPDHGDEVDVLLQRADVAMYKAKGGHAGTVVYRADDDQHSVMRLAMVGELKKAIEERQLLLHYQPKEHPDSGDLAGVEALVRWQHPEWGMIMPDEFISLAEATGLMAPLTRLVLAEALAQLGRWSAQGLETTVAVNVSARSLYDPNFPAEVLGLLAESNIDPQRLTLELTESTILDEPARAMAVLTELSNSGVRLAIDDFGTGYSSLAYLRRLPVHEIKIDKSFVTHMASDASDTVIVRSTIDLARNLGLSLTAEGVEDAATYQLLAELGCDTVQGYFLSRPVPPQALYQWNRRRRPEAPAALGLPSLKEEAELLLASSAD